MWFLYSFWHVKVSELSQSRDLVKNQAQGRYLKKGIQLNLNYKEGNKMKNIGILIIALIAGFIVIGNLGSILILAISVGALYLVSKQYLKAVTQNEKIIWGIIGLIILIAAISNLPAFIGLAAMVLLYYLYKNYKEEKKEKVSYEDPFKKFEREWEELSKK